MFLILFFFYLTCGNEFKIIATKYLPSDYVCFGVLLIQTILGGILNDYLAYVCRLTFECRQMFLGAIGKKFKELSQKFEDISIHINQAISILTKEAENNKLDFIITHLKIVARSVMFLSATFLFIGNFILFLKGG